MDLRAGIAEQFEALNLSYNKELQRMLSFAVKLCHINSAFITLQGHDKEVIKMNHGPVPDIISVNFFNCLKNIRSNDILVINDIQTDARLLSHPKAIKDIKFRFFAAVPLFANAHSRIGSLCITGAEPHALTGQQKLILKILARHIVSVMQLRLSLNQLDNSFKELKEERETRLNNEIKLRSMFESLNDAYFLLGKEGELIDFNRSAYNFVEDVYNVKLEYGFHLIDIFPQRQHLGFKHHLENALKGHKKHMERLTDYGAKGRVWWDCTFDCVKNCKDEIIGASYITRNISERKFYEEKIVEQNRLLTRIAEIQSHDYRAPVASIIGLMQLIELDDYVASKEYLLMLQRAAHALDEKIHEVVNIVTTFR